MTNNFPHGFALLMTDEVPLQRELYRSLLKAGFAPWDRNWLPLFCVLYPSATKAQWFEAGYLAGARVPLILVGKGGQLRRRHAETISRLGGWTVHLESPGGLLGAIERRGLVPSAWDLGRAPMFLERESSRGEKV
jgi:hypothetical protein